MRIEDRLTVFNQYSGKVLSPCNDLLRRRGKMGWWLHMRLCWRVAMMVGERNMSLNGFFPCIRHCSWLGFCYQQLSLSQKNLESRTKSRGHLYSRQYAVPFWRGFGFRREAPLNLSDVLVLRESTANTTHFSNVPYLSWHIFQNH